jgi:hypothetical protein
VVKGEEYGVKGKGAGARSEEESVRGLGKRLIGKA